MHQFDLGLSADSTVLGGASYFVKKLNTRRGWATRQDFGSESDFRSDEAIADSEDIEQRGGMTQEEFSGQSGLLSKLCAPDESSMGDCSG